MRALRIAGHRRRAGVSRLSHRDVNFFRPCVLIISYLFFSIPRLYPTLYPSLLFELSRSQAICTERLLRMLSAPYRTRNPTGSSVNIVITSARSLFHARKRPNFLNRTRNRNTEQTSVSPFRSTRTTRMRFNAM